MKQSKVFKNLVILSTLVNFISCVAVDKWYNEGDFSPFYIENEQKHNWFQAWNECAARNMTLVAVDTPEKNAALVKILSTRFDKRFNAWIGGNDLGIEGVYTWYSTGKNFEFTNWSKGNPDHYKNVEHCIHYYEITEYEWNDTSCVNKMGFICEENRFVNEMRKNLAIKKHFIDQLFLL